MIASSRIERNLQQNAKDTLHCSLGVPPAVSTAAAKQGAAKHRQKTAWFVIKKVDWLRSFYRDYIKGKRYKG